MCSISTERLYYETNTKTEKTYSILPDSQNPQASCFSLFSDHETQWKLFAEGVLRNKEFHKDVMKRGKTCLACNRHFNHEHAAVSSRIDKHHHCYLRLCVGNILPEGSDDIYRPVQKGEYSLVPDFKQCKASNSKYYAGCIKKIFPFHHHCHAQIHEREKFVFDMLGKKLLSGFRSATSLQI